jgi:hypothetical protein
MARIFGRSDTMDDDRAVRDDVDVDPDRDPVIVHDTTTAGERVRVLDDGTRQELVDEEIERRGQVIPQRHLGNAAATSGLVLGIVGTLMGLVPVLFPGALLLGIVGLVASLAGRHRATEEWRRAGRMRATFGILFSLIAIGLGVVGLLIVADVINGFDSTISDAVEKLRDADKTLGDWFN